jgi:hypothetical protein
MSLDVMVERAGGARRLMQCDIPPARSAF